MQKMTHDSYRTIKKPSQGLFKDRGSKFLSFAWPVSTEDDINEKLGSLRRKFHDARHHCYAWRLGVEEQSSRANDDGEPSSTAGKPIMGQIRKFELTNILVVVVRYFGGTLLGTGGLINAYREAAANALSRAEIVTRTVDRISDIRFPYSSLNLVMKVLSQEMVCQVEEDFGDDCRIRIRIPLNKSGVLADRLKRIENVSVQDIAVSY
jgi:uncharacterized YigZ family protein